MYLYVGCVGVARSYKIGFISNEAHVEVFGHTHFPCYAHTFSEPV